MANDPPACSFRCTKTHGVDGSTQKRWLREHGEGLASVFWAIFSCFPIFPPFWITQQVSQHTSLLPTPVRTSPGKSIVSYL